MFRTTMSPLLVPITITSSSTSMNEGFSPHVSRYCATSGTWLESTLPVSSSADSNSLVAAAATDGAAVVVLVASGASLGKSSSPHAFRHGVGHTRIVSFSDGRSAFVVRTRGWLPPIAMDVIVAIGGTLVFWIRGGLSKFGGSSLF